MINEHIRMASAASVRSMLPVLDSDRLLWAKSIEGDHH